MKWKSFYWRGGDLGDKDIWIAKVQQTSLNLKWMPFKMMQTCKHQICTMPASILQSMNAKKGTYKWEGSNESKVNCSSGVLVGAGYNGTKKTWSVRKSPFCLCLLCQPALFIVPMASVNVLSVCENQPMKWLAIKAHFWSLIFSLVDICSKERCQNRFLIRTAVVS